MAHEYGAPNLWRRSTAGGWCIALFIFGVFTLNADASRAQSGPVATKYLTVPLDTDAQELPPNYPGHDPAAVIESIVSIVNPKRDEFETSQQFAVRSLARLEKPVLGALTLDDVFAFRIDVESEYNADKRELTVTVPARYVGNTVDNGQFVVPIASRHKNGSYRAANAFGATATIRQTTGTDYNLLAPPSRTFVGGYRDGDFGALTQVTIPMEPERARLAKGNIRALILCRFASPYQVEATTISIEPTVHEPLDVSIVQVNMVADILEVRFFDSLSGHVWRIAMK